MNNLQESHLTKLKELYSDEELILKNTSQDDQTAAQE